MSNKEETIITWENNGEATAKEIGKKYEDLGTNIIYHGLAVEEELQAIGKSYDASHLLHFLNNEEIILLSFKDEMGGFTVLVQVKDLIFS